MDLRLSRRGGAARWSHQMREWEWGASRLSPNFQTELFKECERQAREKQWMHLFGGGKPSNLGGRNGRL